MPEFRALYQMSGHNTHQRVWIWGCNEMLIEAGGVMSDGRTGERCVVTIETAVAAGEICSISFFQVDDSSCHGNDSHYAKCYYPKTTNTITCTWMFTCNEACPLENVTMVMYSNHGCCWHELMVPHSWHCTSYHDNLQPRVAIHRCHTNMQLQRNGDEAFQNNVKPRYERMKGRRVRFNESDGRATVTASILEVNSWGESDRHVWQICDSRLLFLHRGWLGASLKWVCMSNAMHALSTTEQELEQSTIFGFCMRILHWPSTRTFSIPQINCWNSPIRTWKPTGWEKLIYVTL